MLHKFRHVWGNLGLHGRLLLLTVLLLSVGAMTLSLVEARRMAAVDYEDMLRESVDTMDLLGAAIAEQAIIGDYSSIQELLASRSHNPLVDEVVWQDGRGGVLSARNHGAAPDYPRWFDFMLDLQHPTQARNIEVGGVSYGVVSVRLSVVSLENRMWHRWQSQSLQILVFLAMSLGLIWAILRDSLRPLESVAVVARRFLAGDYQVRVPVSQHMAPEIRDTLEMVNQATESVATLILSLSEQRRALDSAAIVVESDPAGLITYVNDKFCKISGYDRQELLGQTHKFLNSGTHSQEFFKAMWATLIAGKVWHGDICNRAKNGELFWVDTTIIPIVRPDGGIAKFLGVRFDITARKQAEAALRASEESFRQIVETAQEGIWLLDTQALTVYVNQRMANMLGYQVAEMQDRAIFEFVEQEYREAAERHFLRHAGGESDRLDFAFRHQDGSVVWTMISVNPVRDDSGKVAGVLEMVTDITARKRAEMEIQQSREQLRHFSRHLQQVREEEKARIAREIHDELGGTLTALKMDLFWMTRRLPRNDEAALDKTEAMTRLVDSAVQTTRRICTELRPTILDDLGLVAAIEWLAREFQKRTGIECILGVADGETPLDASCSIALFRILQESLTNVSRHANASRVEISLHADSEVILMQIKDNGVGISQAKILNPLSHGIRGMIERARDLGGNLTVNGAPGQGVSISVHIPLARPARVET